MGTRPATIPSRRLLTKDELKEGLTKFGREYVKMRNGERYDKIKLFLEDNSRLANKDEKNSLLKTAALSLQNDQTDFAEQLIHHAVIIQKWLEDDDRTLGRFFRRAIDGDERELEDLDEDVQDSLERLKERVEMTSNTMAPANSQHDAAVSARPGPRKVATTARQPRRPTKGSESRSPPSFAATQRGPPSLNPRDGSGTQSTAARSSSIDARHRTSSASEAISDVLNQLSLVPGSSMTSAAVLEEPESSDDEEGNPGKASVTDKERYAPRILGMINEEGPDGRPQPTDGTDWLSAGRHKQ